MIAPQYSESQEAAPLQWQRSVTPDGIVSPEDQITQTLRTLQATLKLKGWPNQRREDLQAIVAVLEQQWRDYQRGALHPFDASVEVWR